MITIGHGTGQAVRGLASDGAQAVGDVGRVVAYGHVAGGTVIPVVVALDDPAATTGFQEASVTVDVPSDRREDVLSVPVGALVAVDQDRFGVEVVEADGRTRTVAVTTGLFAGGRVEISGDDAEEGQRVVVPRR